MMQLSIRVYTATFSITAGFLINVAALCGKIIDTVSGRTPWMAESMLKKKNPKDNSVYSHFYLNANKKTALR